MSGSILMTAAAWKIQHYHELKSAQISALFYLMTKYNVMNVSIFTVAKMFFWTFYIFGTWQGLGGILIHGDFEPLWGPLFCNTSLCFVTRLFISICSSFQWVICTFLFATCNSRKIVLEKKTWTLVPTLVKLFSTILIEIKNRSSSTFKKYESILSFRLEMT